MVVLISRGRYCTTTTHYDRAAITDPDLWARWLLRGFDEMHEFDGDASESNLAGLHKNVPLRPGRVIAGRTSVWIVCSGVPRD